MAAVYTVQTLLMRMLRDAGAVSVAITPASDRTDKFLAGFTIDGQGPFVLATDKCKPRLLKNANEVESLIRRACVHVAALSVAWPDPAHLRKRANATRQAADDAALVSKGAALAASVAARRAKAAAVVAKINAEWADGAHKAERLVDLAAEIAAADGWLAFAANRTLPDGGAVVVPDPVPDPDPNPDTDAYMGHPITAEDYVYFDDIPRAEMIGYIDSGEIIWVPGEGWLWGPTPPYTFDDYFNWWNAHANQLTDDRYDSRPKMTRRMFDAYYVTRDALRLVIIADMSGAPNNGYLLGFRTDDAGTVTGSAFNDARIAGAIVLNGDTWDFAQ